MRYGYPSSLAGLALLLAFPAAYATDVRVRTVFGVDRTPGLVAAVGYAPDRKSVMTIELHEKGAFINQLERRSMKTIRSRPVDGQWRCAAIAPNAQWIALGGVDRICLVELGTGQATSIELKGGQVVSLAISSDSQLLAASNHPGAEDESRHLNADDEASVVQVWSLPGRKLLGTFKCNGQLPVAFSADGRLLRVLEIASHQVAAEPIEYQWRIHLKEWSVQDGRVVRSIDLGRQIAMATSSDGKLLAFASLLDQGPSPVRLMENEHDTTVRTLDTYGPVRLLAFTGDGRDLVCCRDLTWRSWPRVDQIERWDLTTGRCVIGADLDVADPRAIACSTDGDEIIVGGAQPASEGDTDRRMRPVLKIWSFTDADLQAVKRGPFTIDTTPDYAPPDPNVPIPATHDKPGISWERASDIAASAVIVREGWFGTPDPPARVDDCWLVRVCRWPRNPADIRIVRIGDDGKVRAYQRGK